MRPRSSSLSSAAILVLMGLAGCLDGGPDDLGLPLSPFEGVPLPPGCRADVRAVAHGADAGQLPDAVGCISIVPTGTWEPSLGIHPKSGAVFVYPAIDGSAGSLATVSVARSGDHGATWEFLTPNVAGQPTHPLTLDPIFYLDPATGRIFLEDLLTPQCGVLSWSDDEGTTWAGHTVSGCTQADHVTIFAGPPTLSTTVGYPNVVYRCAINTVTVLFASFTSTCQKSLDGGRTWVQTGTPAFYPDPTRTGFQGIPGWCDGAVGHGTVGPDGTIYLPKGSCGVPMLATSRDEGLTWTRSQVSDLGNAVAWCQAWDHEGSVGVDSENNVYYAWIDNQRVPRLAVSRDGGATWGPGIDLRPPGVTQASLAQLAVGGVGKVAVSYMASTNAPEGPFPAEPALDPQGCAGELSGDRTQPAYDQVTWSGYIGMTWDALEDTPSFVTGTINDPEDPLSRGGPCGLTCPGQADFYDLQIAPDGTPWATFTEACVDGCVTGEETSTNHNEPVAGRLWGPFSLVDGSGD